MKPNLSTAGSLIQHEHVAIVRSRPSVTIGPKSKSDAAANIRLNKNGELIESIELKCACGETIVIQCEYE
jgi:hypothetical protein